MSRRLLHSIARRSWWWVFGLFIALPAGALALLGLSAIGADEIERQQRIRDQQAHILRLADVALSNVFEREATDARAKVRATPSADAAEAGAVLFDIDSRNAVSFPAHRINVSPFDVESVNTQGQLSADLLAQVERARAAEAQNRSIEAAAFYGRLRAVPQLREWAGLQLVLQRSSESPTSIAAHRDRLELPTSDARSPSGIPLAIVASSLNEDASPAERQHFAPLLKRTLQSLRQGRWWLDLEQRRVYDQELRRWLSEIAAESPIADDERLDTISRIAPAVLRAFADSQRFPSRALVVGAQTERLFVVWTGPSEAYPRWSGVAIRGERAGALVAGALETLLKDQPFRAELRERDSHVWGIAVGERLTRPMALESLPGWALTFSEPQAPAGTRTEQLMNYARVALPMIVLACGLLMTAWIMRRELALARLQSTFVSAVTHEFKSPITSIRLLMERITSGRISAGDTHDRYYAAIAAEADRLESLVNRLLEAQKLQSGQRTYVFEPADIQALVRDAVDRMRPQAEARHMELTLGVAGGLPALQLDTESVSDAVRNLLDNAIKYSFDHTRIEVSLAEQNGRVELTVVDQGIGVQSAEAERIFEPFYRSPHGDRTNVHGTGLGLALVKATAEAHGGSISVFSDGQQGSRFTLVFPTDFTRSNAAGIKTASPAHDSAMLGRHWHRS